MKLKIRFPLLLAFAAMTILMPWAPVRALDGRNELKDAAAPREITPRGETFGR
jgi:hypothetical protein